MSGNLVMKWKERPAESKSQGGLFIVLEGIDGSGKTTQARLLAERLQDAGLSVLVTAEPSQGPVGKRLRSLLKRLPADLEARLFAEDRAHHVEHEIVPALCEGRVVICDRYVYSSVAYQGARGMDPLLIMRANEGFAVKPDVIFLIEVPVDLALERLVKNRRGERSAYETRENMERVAAIYESISDPLLVKLSGSAAEEEVHRRLFGALSERIGLQRGGSGPW